MSRIRRLGIGIAVLLAALAAGACGSDATVGGPGGARGKASAFQQYQEGLLTCPTDWRGVRTTAGLTMRLGPAGAPTRPELLRDGGGEPIRGLPAGTRFSVASSEPELAELGGTFYLWRQVATVLWNGERVDLTDRNVWVAENKALEYTDRALVQCGVRPLEADKLAAGEFSSERRGPAVAPARGLMPEGWALFGQGELQVDVKDHADGDFAQLTCGNCSTGIQKVFEVPAGRHIVWVPIQQSRGAGRTEVAFQKVRRVGDAFNGVGEAYSGGYVEQVGEATFATTTVEGPALVLVQARVTTTVGIEAGVYDVQVLPEYDPNTRVEGFDQLGTLPVSSAAYADAEVFARRSTQSDPYASGRLPHGFSVVVGDENLDGIANAVYDRRVQVVDERLTISTRGGYWGVSTSFYGLSDLYKVSVPLQVVEGAVNDVKIVINYRDGLDSRANKVVELKDLKAGDWAVAEATIADFAGQLDEIKVSLLVHGVWSPDRGNASATVAFDGIWIEQDL